MNYTKHILSIKTNFPDLDLLKESEFGFFKNEKFARSCIESCVDLCNKSSEILGINLNFGIIYDHSFNGTARVLKQLGVITFNLGLVEKLGKIISDSINLFMMENIASFTINENQKEKLKQISHECCIAYLFYHELAHIIQLLGVKENNSFHFQEKYFKEKNFDIKKHIYEFDADLFGSLISAIELMKKVKDENQQFNVIVLFNSLTALLFTTANIIIEYSGNIFKEIYYKKNTHPHPFIRIIKCHEQILGNVSKNLNAQRELFEAVLQRSTTMISQILYSDGRTLNFENFYKENLDEIDSYINMIEEENKLYEELMRYKSTEFLYKFIH